ncbi:NADPH-dependent FMN reductase [Dyadobacter sp. CY356]|uniref:NADPH-dependent FMN reductase n=1 Tax=Dyadobacter sp. CY356 TaxID=2906442 RepID=UPI001F46A68C|nr:NAD(P)H-dependent oxidoreductase [Dyadobacter sp. CY356]MCF0055597.1 NAD(P)H-dependent oxidoreductase [Dyadobacter sp. CY356]
MKNIQILAISGSLRVNSANTNILKSIGEMTDDSVDFQIFEGLDTFPHFNPGVDMDNEKVALFRKKVKEADGVIFCTPEYAFGIPGVLKNALDWTVSTGEFNDKPVAAISASPLNTGGDKALASLILTLTALGTYKNEKSLLSIPNIKQKINGEGALTDSLLKKDLELILNNLLEQVKEKRGGIV